MSEMEEREGVSVRGRWHGPWVVNRAFVSFPPMAMSHPSQMADDDGDVMRTSTADATSQPHGMASGSAEDGERNKRKHSYVDDVAEPPPSDEDEDDDEEDEEEEDEEDEEEEVRRIARVRVARGDGVWKRPSSWLAIGCVVVRRSIRGRAT